jgi:hypothetical protein
MKPCTILFVLLSTLLPAQSQYNAAVKLASVKMSSLQTTPGVAWSDANGSRTLPRLRPRQIERLWEPKPSRAFCARQSPLSWRSMTEKEQAQARNRMVPTAAGLQPESRLPVPPPPYPNSPLWLVPSRYHASAVANPCACRLRADSADCGLSPEPCWMISSSLGGTSGFSRSAQALGLGS